MSREELIKSLEYFLEPSNSIGAVLYFVVENEEDTVIRFADVEDDTKHELKNRFLEYIRDTIVNNAELTYRQISQADDRATVIYKYDLDEQPENLSMLSDINVNGKRETFNFDNCHLQNINGYLVTIGNEEHKMVLYKKHHPINLLRQDRFLLIPHNQRLQKVNHDVIAFDRSFDFMLVDGNLFIHKLKTLERFFGFDEVVRKQASRTIDVINSNQVLVDITELVDLAENLTHARKLMGMRNSPVLRTPVDVVIDFIRRHPELSGKIRFNDCGTKIKLDTLVSKKLFLKLLNDDYLFSQLTEVQYDSHAKDKLNGHA